MCVLSADLYSSPSLPQSLCSLSYTSPLPFLSIPSLVFLSLYLSLLSFLYSLSSPLYSHSHFPNITIPPSSSSPPITHSTHLHHSSPYLHSAPSASSPDSPPHIDRFPSFTLSFSPSAFPHTNERLHVLASFVGINSLHIMHP